MSNRITIAALAAFMTVIAAPAFAGDQDTATELRDSGRYIGRDEPSRLAPMRRPARPAASRRQSQPLSDFQLVGHN